VPAARLRASAPRGAAAPTVQDLFEHLCSVDLARSTSAYARTAGQQQPEVFAFLVPWEEAAACSALARQAHADVLVDCRFTSTFTVPMRRLIVDAVVPPIELARVIASAADSAQGSAQWEVHAAANRVLNEGAFGMPVAATPTVDLLAVLLVDAAGLPGDDLLSEQAVDWAYTRLCSALAEHPDLLAVARAESQLAPQ
jgi:hypothetical protein